MEELRNSSSMAAPSEGEASAQLTVVSQRKRSLPGTPDPDGEVIALSSKSLLAKNKFLCEICSKGFQRDQNLQLHQRGHNLPWTLKQRGGKPKRRVYICPEKNVAGNREERRRKWRSSSEKKENRYPKYAAGMEGQTRQPDLEMIHYLAGGRSPRTSQP